MSRNRLMRAYPANVKEIGFLEVMGETAPFPPWLVGVGAFAYWGIGGPKRMRRPTSPETVERIEPVVNTLGTKGGIEYADAYLKDNDARFVCFIRSAWMLALSQLTTLNWSQRNELAEMSANLRDVESERNFH